LIAADSAAILIEKLRKTPGKKMSIKTLQTELAKSSKTQPWLNENILKCVEIGLTLKRFFHKKQHKTSDIKRPSKMLI
jgi:hypothetical protein